MRLPLVHAALACSVVAQTPGPPPEPALAPVALNREPASRGLRFLRLSFPARALLDPELVGPGLPARGLRPFERVQRRFELALPDAGVDVLDFSPVIFQRSFGRNGDRDDPLHLRSDPHWTPRDALRGARERRAAKRAVVWLVSEQMYCVEESWSPLPRFE